MTRILALILLLFAGAISAQSVQSIRFKSVQSFINSLVEKHDFDKDELLTIFATIQLEVAKKSSKKSKKKAKAKTMTWDKYKNLFITDERIASGVAFWQKHLSTLKNAEEKYQLPIEIIIAILGIETNYGEKKGDFPTLQTLTKRAFGNYRRRNFYKKELRQFLLMTRENAIAPLSIKGSYAGAMGYPQFISSSYIHYAVDFNQDGKIDLFSDPVDAIGSIGNYFSQHHWIQNGELARPIMLDKTQLKHASRATNKPKKTAKYWRNKGFAINSNINNKTKIAFISLPQQAKNETWLTFWNFYVITRYNHDNRYAMTVYQLSEKIKQNYKNL